MLTDQDIQKIIEASIKIFAIKFGILKILLNKGFLF